MRLQETPDEIPEGGTPHTVSLLMHDKLVDTGKPGDRVEVRLYSNILGYKDMFIYFCIHHISCCLVCTSGNWYIQGYECQGGSNSKNS